MDLGGRMSGLKWLANISVLMFVVAAAGAGQTAQRQTTYDIDSTRSTMEIDVYREGLFKAFGHDHLVAAKEFSGRVILNPDNLDTSSVTFRVATKSLTAVDPQESGKDRNAVQATMQGKDVLDAEQYPEVTFSSTSVNKPERKSEKWNLMLDGKLKLHGVEKPIHLPLTLSFTDNELTAVGEIFLLQTDYGITPVKVAGGTVKVKDRIRIRFQIHAAGTKR